MKPRQFKTRSAFEAFVFSQAARGKVWHATIVHDADCPPYRCRCKPSFEVEPATKENLLAGQERQAEWLKGWRS